MDVLTTHTATIALVAGAVVLALGIAWALRAPHRPGRRFIPSRRRDGVVSAILVLDGCVLAALGALAHFDGGADRVPETPRAARETAAGPPDSGGPDERAGTSPAPTPEQAGGARQAAPPAGRPRRARADLVARLSGDGVTVPGAAAGDPDGRGGVWLDLRPRRRHLCFDMAIGPRIAGSITRAYVYRTAAGEGALPQLTLVVPDGRPARRRRGCAGSPPTADLRPVVDRPRDFHVTIFTEAYPAGAVRGTLRSCPRPCATRARDLLR